jgi:hypothetical protein
LLDGVVMVVSPCGPPVIGGFCGQITTFTFTDNHS